MFAVVTVVFLFACYRQCLARNNGYFISPPDAGQQLLFVENEVYVIGDDWSIQWLTEQSQYSVWLWQQSLSVSTAALGQAVYTKIAGGPEEGGFNWTATRQSFDLHQSNVFFFALGPSQEITDNTTTSHYFNLTESTSVASTTQASSQASSSVASTTQAPSQASSSLPATISPSLSGSTSASTDSASATNASIPNPKQNDDTSSSGTVTKIGLGVGLGIGIPSFALCVYFIFRNINKHKKAAQPEARVASMMDGGSAAYFGKPMSPKEVSGENRFGHYQEKEAFRHHVMAELPVDRPALAQR